ncbi:MAG: aldo/keto reductase, partial [Novosphingobium sp.]|nr:aldo/keto reductase [Novosphingobium sp.]
MNLHDVNMGFGTYGIGGYKQKDTSRDSFYLNLLLDVYREGIKFFDTAENYAEGYSEELLGKAFRGIRKDVIIATKLSPENMLSADNIRRSIDKSLERLNTDYIDLYQIHWPHPKANIYEVIDVLFTSIKEGKILRVGLCNFYDEELKLWNAKLRGNLHSVQNEFNLVENFSNNISDNSVKDIAYSPFKYINDISSSKKKYLSFLRDKYNCSSNQLILSWISSLNKIPLFTSHNIPHIKHNIVFPELTKRDSEEITNTFKSKIEYINFNRITY